MRRGIGQMLMLNRTLDNFEVHPPGDRWTISLPSHVDGDATHMSTDGDRGSTNRSGFVS